MFFQFLLMYGDLDLWMEFCYFSDIDFTVQRIGYVGASLEIACVQ